MYYFYKRLNRERSMHRKSHISPQLSRTLQSPSKCLATLAQLTPNHESVGKKGGDLPHNAAHRISELNLFLYLRISGVSLCGLVLVGFTLTTEPLRVGSCLMASGRIPSQENPTATENIWDDFLAHRDCSCLPLLCTSSNSNSVYCS